MIFGAVQRPPGAHKQGAGITTTLSKTFVCVREGDRAVPARYVRKRDVDF